MKKERVAFSTLAVATILVLLTPASAQAAMKWYAVQAPRTQASIVTSPQYPVAAGGRAQVQGSGATWKIYIDNYSAGSRVGGSSAGGWSWADFTHPSANYVKSYCYWNYQGQISGTLTINCGIKQTPADTGTPAGRVAPTVTEEPQPGAAPGSTAGLAASEYVNESGEHCLRIVEGSYKGSACTSEDLFQRLGLAVSIALPDGQVKAAYLTPSSSSGEAGSADSAGQGYVRFDTAVVNSRADNSEVVVISDSGRHFEFPDLATGWLVPSLD